MAHLYRHTEKEVHLLSGPSTLQPVTIALPHNDYGIITQYTSREKDQDLPQLLSTSEAQHTQGTSHSCEPEQVKLILDYAGEWV